MLPLPSIAGQGYRWCGRPWRGPDLPTVYLQQTRLAPPVTRPARQAATAPSPGHCLRFARQVRTPSDPRPGCRRDVSPRDTCNTRSDWTPPPHSPPLVSLPSPLPSLSDLLLPCEYCRNLSCHPAVTCDMNASEFACCRPSPLGKPGFSKRSSSSSDLVDSFLAPQQQTVNLKPGWWSLISKFSNSLLKPRNQSKSA